MSRTADVCELAGLDRDHAVRLRNFCDELSCDSHDERRVRTSRKKNKTRRRFRVLFARLANREEGTDRPGRDR
jgi:hypothetical protein